MPIIPPRLDDRSFDDLVAELVARIPAHTQEWTHPRVGDPGRTLIDLFAWLGDTILYRANLIPERQRLRFLQLLGMRMRPAVPATGIIRVSIDDETASQTLVLRSGASIQGPVVFESIGELNVLPVTGQAFIKRRATDIESKELAETVRALEELFEIDSADPYVSTPVFIDGRPDPVGIDLIDGTVDQSLWIALLAAEGVSIDDIRDDMREGAQGQPRVISVGIVPATAPIQSFDDLPDRESKPSYVWEMTTGRMVDGEPEYSTMGVESDGTSNLRRNGIVRLILPARRIGAPSNELTDQIRAGVGKAPPRLDDPEVAARLVSWVRLRPVETIARLPVGWVGVNAIAVDQRQTLANRVVAQSDGSADLTVQLPATSIEPDTLQIHVEESGRGFQPWVRVDDLATVGDSPAFELDSEAGTLHFGDGIRGRAPEATARIRVVQMRAGGGTTGNLPAGSLKEITAYSPAGQRITQPLKLSQDMATQGGIEAERIEDAELRIPSKLRHRNRAVTEFDFRTLAASTPGVPVGRVEVMAKFKPHQRRENVPGVVSVMVLPFKAAFNPPNPRPDRLMVETVYDRLDARRTLGTELYVIGTEYIPIGMGVGVTLRDGFPRDETLQSIRLALHRYLWPLAPGGFAGTGWPLDTDVSSAELEVTVARVAGVRTVGGVSLFVERSERWIDAPRINRTGAQVVRMRPWQLPELLTVVVIESQNAPTDLSGAPDPFANRRPDGTSGSNVSVPVPVVPEIC